MIILVLNSINKINYIWSYFNKKYHKDILIKILLKKRSLFNFYSILKEQNFLTSILLNSFIYYNVLYYTIMSIFLIKYGLLTIRSSP